MFFSGAFPLLIAPVPLTILIVGVRADPKKGPIYRTLPDLNTMYEIINISWKNSMS